MPARARRSRSRSRRAPCAARSRYRTTSTEQRASCATRSLTLPSDRIPWSPRLPTTSRSGSSRERASTGEPDSIRSGVSGPAAASSADRTAAGSGVPPPVATTASSCDPHAFAIAAAAWTARADSSEPSAPTTTRAGNASPASPRAISTGHGASCSSCAATLPSRMPERRRWSCDPTATRVASWRPASVSIIGPGGPSTTTVSTAADAGKSGRTLSAAARSSSCGNDPVRAIVGDQPTATDAPVFHTQTSTTRDSPPEASISRPTWATAARLSSVPSTPQTTHRKSVWSASMARSATLDEDEPAQDQDAVRVRRVRAAVVLEEALLLGRVDVVVGRHRRRGLDHGLVEGDLHLLVGPAGAVSGHHVQLMAEKPARDEQELGLAGLLGHVDVGQLADVLPVLRVHVQLVPVMHLEW